MIDKNLIRSLIRDVIAEEVTALKAGKSATTAPAASIRIGSDADLVAFARDVLRLAEDPQIRAAIQAGRHPFHLAGQASAMSAPATSSATQSHRIDKGVVTEAVIAKLGKGVSRLLLGTGVSITPLARDKAKARNISVERIGQ
ncbi:MAG: hypothetical protein IPK59_09910 [Rhodospirillaceae bacterium]|nr:hypothetical protein [Rhodospirillaceae bacterium]